MSQENWITNIMQKAKENNIYNVSNPYNLSQREWIFLCTVSLRQTEKISERDKSMSIFGEVNSSALLFPFHLWLEISFVICIKHTLYQTLLTYFIEDFCIFLSKISPTFQKPKGIPNSQAHRIQNISPHFWNFMK